MLSIWWPLARGPVRGGRSDACFSTLLQLGRFSTVRQFLSRLSTLMKVFRQMDVPLQTPALFQDEPLPEGAELVGRAALVAFLGVSSGASVGMVNSPSLPMTRLNWQRALSRKRSTAPLVESVTLDGRNRAANGAPTLSRAWLARTRPLRAGAGRRRISPPSPGSCGR